MTSINLMPMAGKGKRFKKEKFLIHKPFIKINDNYMFLEASKCMPNANKWIFIYNQFQKKNIILKNNYQLI